MFASERPRSKSVEITDTATSVQEKHGSAQVSTCVSIISIMYVEMKWISFCQERSCSRRVCSLACSTGQFVAGALRDDTKYGCFVD